MSGIFTLAFVFNVVALVVRAVERARSSASRGPSAAAREPTQVKFRVDEATSETAVPGNDALSRKVEELLEGQAVLRELLNEATGIGTDARPHQQHSVRDKSQQRSKRHGSSKDLHRAHTSDAHLVGSTSPLVFCAEAQNKGRRRRHTPSPSLRTAPQSS